MTFVHVAAQEGGTPRCVCKSVEETRAEERAEPSAMRADAVCPQHAEHGPLAGRVMPSRMAASRPPHELSPVLPLGSCRLAQDWCWRRRQGVGAVAHGLRTRGLRDLHDPPARTYIRLGRRSRVAVELEGPS